MTTWGTANAEDLYRIATRLAGFDAQLEQPRHERGDGISRVWLDVNIPTDPAAP